LFGSFSKMLARLAFALALLFTFVDATHPKHRPTDNARPKRPIGITQRFGVADAFCKFFKGNFGEFEEFGWFWVILRSFVEFEEFWVT
jgi:hypothetical protein